MIIWLASYPKSGNTLLRAMLSAYLFSKDGLFDFELLKGIKQFPNHDIMEDLNINVDDKNEIIKNSIRCQEYFDNKNSVGFVKTHTMLFNYKRKYPFTNLDHTLGVIYLVRDPRNVVLSYARHLDISVEEAVKFMTTGKVIVNDIQGNWSENYLSWKAMENDKYLLIKYEEFILNPREVFLKILKFIFRLRNINFSIDQNKLDNVIKSTTLDNLKNLEKNNNFQEAMKTKKEKKKINFFDKGGKRDWRKSLDKNLINKIETLLKNEMVELGYL